MIPDQYPNYYKALEIYAGYFDILGIMILISYPSSIINTRDSGTCALIFQFIIVKISETCNKTVNKKLVFTDEVLFSGWYRN